MAKKEEEFEEFEDDGEELGLDEPAEDIEEVEVEAEEPKPKRIRTRADILNEIKKLKDVADGMKPEPPEPKQPVEPEQKFVAVPRAVPLESMVNEIYDSNQEIKQALVAILEKLK